LRPKTKNDNCIVGPLVLD